MYAKLVRERITQLRLQKGISEYKMSYELGHCKGYINNISSGKALPSLSEFFAICDYFGITPLEFFDTDIKNPTRTDRMKQKLETLSPEDLSLVSDIIDRLSEKN
ncbi:MAG: helix-turn-helix transcriptional regulator [Clostridia bacterium]|nr:helix-turn-helix transcriptional regulator [Clostridia bacterium]